jgi:adenosylhomocysteine nucleosidase
MSASPMTVLCASGLAAEAKIARAAGFSVVVGAGDRERTERLVGGALRRANCLVSFGIAGALSPQLRAGDIIVSGEVFAADGSWRAEQPFRAGISALARDLAAYEGPVLGTATILASLAEKRRAWAETGALAVDLESDVVARAASAAGIPFIVVRTVADGPLRALPPAALIPLAADGTPRLGRVMASVLRRPRQLAALIGLARETRLALAALKMPAQALHGLLATA